MSILPNLQIQFPAGKMNFDPITKKVLADPRKGSIRVYQNSDNEKRFFWIDEVSKTEEIDLYVFENDAKFEKVVQAKGRIYLLRFDSMEEKYFFWFQDPDVSTDEKNLNKVNEILNFHEKIEEEIEEHKAQPQIENKTMDPNKLIQNLAAKLQEIQSSKKRDTPALAEVLKSDYLNSICEDEEFKNALIPLLPEGQQTIEDLKLNLKSPQFLQALDSLEYALNSEAGYSVLMSMGIDPKIFYENGGDGNDALYKGLEKMWKK